MSLRLYTLFAVSVTASAVVGLLVGTFIAASAIRSARPASQEAPAAVISGSGDKTPLYGINIPPH